MLSKIIKIKSLFGLEIAKEALILKMLSLEIKITTRKLDTISSRDLLKFLRHLKLTEQIRAAKSTKTLNSSQTSRNKEEKLSNIPLILYKKQKNFPKSKMKALPLKPKRYYHHHQNCSKQEKSLILPQKSIQSLLKKYKDIINQILYSKEKN